MGGSFRGGFGGGGGRGFGGPPMMGGRGPMAPAGHDPMWAAQGYPVPGPGGWTQYRTPDTGELYYHNQQTGVTTWWVSTASFLFMCASCLTMHANGFGCLVNMISCGKPNWMDAILRTLPT